MVPAQLMAEAVAVLADSGAKAFDLPDKRIAIEIGKVFVHVVLLMAKPRSRAQSYCGPNTNKKRI